MKITNLSLKAEKLESIVAFKDFDGKLNLPLLAQAVHVYRDRSHIGVVKVKTRAEVNKTTKKMYKQKGTGNARHGSAAAPIFVGGGKAHGPRPVRRIRTLSAALRKQALVSAINMKAREADIFALSGMEKMTKTKVAQDFVSSFLKVNKIKNKNTKFTFVLKGSENQKAVRNMANIKTLRFNEINAYNMLFGGTLVFDARLFETEKKKVSPSVKAKPSKQK